MKTHRFFNVARPVLGLLLIVTCVAVTVAGGFQLRIDVPQDDSDVVVLVRTYRCHQPEKAKVTGTAEGLVDGQRVSVPLTLKTVEKGVYSVERQWPARGAWVLAFSGSYAGHHTSTVVTLDDQGKVAIRETERGTELDARILPRKLKSKDVERALRRITAP